MGEAILHHAAPERVEKVFQRLQLTICYGFGMRVGQYMHLSQLKGLKVLILLDLQYRAMMA